MKFIEKNKLGIFHQQTPFRTKGVCWGTSLLLIECQHEVIEISTPIGNFINVHKYINGTTTKKIVDRNGNKVNDSKIHINDIKIDMSYNCHGYSFFNKKYWVDDEYIDTILSELFLPVTSIEEADIAVLYQYVDIDDYGNDIYKLIHSAGVNKDGTVSYKNGIQPLIENAPISMIGSKYNFNKVVFYRRI